MRTRKSAIAPYTTRDGSLIRELMHPSLHGNQNQSLAEAEIGVGGRTALHRHHRSEEIYHIIQGRGLMILGDERLEVRVGDTVSIPAGSAHRLENTGGTTLRVLCSCAPPYSHEDTELLE